MAKQPEHTMQAWLARFLDAAVLDPCYHTGIDHPFVIGAAKNIAHQNRLRARGIKPGTADVYVCQAPARSLWLELKWGKNKTSDTQDAFSNAIWRCGIGYEVCYSIHDALAALTRAGFRLHQNAHNLATEYQHRVETSIAAQAAQKRSASAPSTPQQPASRVRKGAAPKQPTAKARKAWQTYAKLLP